MKSEKLTPYDVIVKPILTEKTHLMMNDRKYVFEVNPLANKGQIKEAIEKIFDVKVEKVNVVNVKPKPKRRGIYQGKSRRWKKAIVTLKEGYVIKELMPEI
ncbi:MAG: 50S ribosomal protein L23 [Thermotogaceae bacterium]|nr:50S ribosomal protein L23 [Thermotogaceae bacterium]